jgi:lambda family phage portal protein
VNYSSLRAGLLDEREEWKAVQQWLIEELCEPVFEDWLSWSLGLGFILLPNGSALPQRNYDKFNAPEWKPRRWPWVDPLKDMQASVLAVEKGFDSRRRIIAEEGKDIEDVFLEQKEDAALAEEYGLEFPTDAEAKAGAQVESANQEPASAKGKGAGAKQEVEE